MVFTYDGSRQQPGLSLYLNGKAIPTQGRGNQNTDLPGDIGIEGPLTLGRNLRFPNRVAPKRTSESLAPGPHRNRSEC